MLLAACDILGTQCTWLVSPFLVQVSYRSCPHFIISYDVHILGVIKPATSVSFMFYGP